MEQEILILIWENVERYNDMEFYKTYFYKTLEGLFFNTLVEEHKQGLWITDSIFCETSDGEEINILEVEKINSNSIVEDKWLEELYKKRREAKRQYRKTEKGINTRREYQKSEKYKEYRRRYKKTDRYREYQNGYQKKYRDTEKSKEYFREYRKTEKYKEYQREYQRKYRERKRLEKVG